jgi:hypothetical protein
MQMRANSPLLRFLIAAPPRLSDLFVAQAEKRRQEHERNKCGFGRDSGGIRVMLPRLKPEQMLRFYLDNTSIV